MPIKQEMDQFGQVSDNLDGQANGLTKITNGVQKLTLVGSTANSLSSQNIKSSPSNAIIKMEIKQEFPLHGHNLANIYLKLQRMEQLSRLYIVSQSQIRQFKGFFRSRNIRIDHFVRTFDLFKVTGQPNLDYMAAINLYCFWVQTAMDRSGQRRNVATVLDDVRRKLETYHGTQFGSFYELSKNQKEFLLDYLTRSTEFPYSSDYLKNLMNLNKNPSQPDLDKGVWATFYHLYLTTLKRKDLSTLRNRDLEAIRTENSSLLSQSVQPSQVLTQTISQEDKSIRDYFR